MSKNTPSCTNTLQRIVNVSQNFVRNAPLTFSGINDPAFIIADWVRGFMLAPPFAWRWNRTNVVFTMSAGTQDYQKNVPGFGWLEEATIEDTSTSPVSTYQLMIRTNLGEETVENQPRMVSAQYDDSNGNITFRFTPPPDKSYIASLTFQMSPPIFTSMNDLWAPIPDYLSFLYTQGMLAKTYEYLGDPRFGSAMPLFLRQVIAANAGLDEIQTNIFLAERLTDIRETAAAQQKGQLGRISRGMYAG